MSKTGFETADALDRFRAVQRGQTYKILFPSDLDEAIEALEEKLNRCPATENKPLTNLEALFGTPEKIADVLLPMLPTMEGFCPCCKHWINGACEVNPHWDCKNALVNWLNQPYARKPEQEEK